MRSLFYGYSFCRIFASLHTRTSIQCIPACSFSHSFSMMSQSNEKTLSFEESEVLVERLKGKKVLTMNRSKALNALNLNMVRQIYDELKIQSNFGSNSFDLVIMKGFGPKAFCAGGDVLAVSKSYKDGSSLYWKEFFHDEYRLNYLIGILPSPYVALMDGITMGGGCGVSINGRFRVATENTMLAMPETALGLFPDVGGTHFLSRLRDNLGLFMALTGHRLVGADVFHAGLATHYINSYDLFDLEEALLNLSPSECNEKSVDSLINQFRPKPDDIPPFTLDPHMETIRWCFNADSVESLLDKLRKNGSFFAQQQMAALSKMSPTSLKVTFRQITQGKKLSFAEVFPVEYRLVQRFMHASDFHEGCRAILIDKCRNPKWLPSMIEDVTDADVDAYFDPFQNPGEELVLE